MEDKIIFYTTDCPRCMVLKKKMDSKGIEYEENHNVKEMIALGYLEAPHLYWKGKDYNYSEAIEFVNNYTA